MSKYIRTKDGKIFSVLVSDQLSKDEVAMDIIGFRIQTALKQNKCIAKKDNILKVADTIEELIMPGDLVRYDGLYMSWIEKDRGDKVRGIDMHLIPRKSVDMLWIPTGNDTECYPNFKLVASKEDKKGELGLL